MVSLPQQFQYDARLTGELSVRRRIFLAGMSLVLKEYQGAKLLKPQESGLRSLLTTPPKTSSRRHIPSQVPGLRMAENSI